MVDTFDGAKDVESWGDGKPKESAVQGGPNYDGRPKPKTGGDIGPNAVGIYKNPGGK